MKLLLLARGPLGFGVTKFLLTEYPGDLAAVVTARKDDIFDLAVRRGIPTYEFKDGADLVRELQAADARPDLGALIWWPTIIKEPLLSFPIRGFVNTHPSLLPYCRGSLSNFWALVEEAPYGVSIHKVDAEVDHGDVLAQSKIEVGWEDTDETLYGASLRELERLFIGLYPSLREGEARAVPQNPATGSIHRLAETGPVVRLDLDAPTTARRLFNLLRGRSYSKTDGCWFEDGDERFEVRISITKKPAVPAPDRDDRKST